MFLGRKTYIFGGAHRAMPGGPIGQSGPVQYYGSFNVAHTAWNIYGMAHMAWHIHRGTYGAAWYTRRGVAHTGRRGTYGGKVPLSMSLVIAPPGMYVDFAPLLLPMVLRFDDLVVIVFEFECIKCNGYPERGSLTFVIHILGIELFPKF